MLANTYLRKIILFLFDAAIISLAYLIAFKVRLLDNPELGVYAEVFNKTLPWLLLIRMTCGLLVRQYTWAFRLASLSEAVSLVKAGVAGSILFYFLTLQGDLAPARVPYSVLIFELGFSLAGFIIIRFLPRYLYQQYIRRSSHLGSNGETHLRTLIYGAGHTGELILRDLSRTRIYPYKVIGFIDDDPVKWNTSIHGIRVLGSQQDLPELIARYTIDKILVAIPNIEGVRLRKVIDICANHHIRFKIVPRYANLVAKGETTPITLKDIQLEDLLSREPVAFDHARMAEFFVGKTALVTGAGGSIGSEICRQISKQGVKRIVAVDLNENDLYFLNLELQDEAPNVEISLEIASIRDRDRMMRLFKKERPAIVYHAAAHKHVPLMEHCPLEALKNNVLGTKNVVDAAHDSGVERFVLISSDKAVRPTNVMGATKRLAEFIVQHRNQNSSTQFMAVRFGNVLGSNGSLIQILQRQIHKGGPVTITHPKITRYFMTIPEAVGLVLVSSFLSEGCLYVLDMGEAVHIDRLARQMISLSGLIPEQDIEVVYTGLRPGEKMYEELFTDRESQRPSAHQRIQIATFDTLPNGLDRLESQILELVDQENEFGAYQLLKTLIPGFTPDAKRLEKFSPAYEEAGSAHG